MKLIKDMFGLCLGISLLFNATITHSTTSEPIPNLETSVDNYMTAWQKQDFITMNQDESWEGGEELNNIQYIQSFESDFRIHNWKVTRMQEIDNDQYKVLILIRHTLPKQIAGFLPPGHTVRSTRLQWWKKQGDKFVHLYHIENQKLIELIVPQQPPS